MTGGARPDIFDGSADSGGGPALIARLCALCVEVLPVAGVAVSMTVGTGHRGTVHASDSRAAVIEDLHFGLGEGPGIEALRTGRAVLVSDLSAPDDGGLIRWPIFAPAAAEAGARAMLAFPLVLGAAELGVLLMYAQQPVTLSRTQRAWAFRLADAVTVALLDLLSGSPSNELAGRGSSDSGDAVAVTIDEGFFRSEVHQAAGMLVADLEVGIEEAMVRMRAYAFAAGRLVPDVARDIVRGTLRLEPDNE